MTLKREREKDRGLEERGRGSPSTFSGSGRASCVEEGEPEVGAGPGLRLSEGLLSVD